MRLRTAAHWATGGALRDTGHISRCRARNAPSSTSEPSSSRCGVDLTRIDGIDVTALVVVSRGGHRHVPLPTVKHFVLLAGLVPRDQDHRRQGVERQDLSAVPTVPPRSLRLAAAALRSSQSALGAYFRRMCAAWTSLRP